ncbi:hypothetical protein WwAna1589 [Wolbachia endosymbiont of Drosophila ananassae]|nr:hypothetical protein WwAna1589 [Wolbachia endosymbiont of Drosophila ananassae]
MKITEYLQYHDKGAGEVCQGSFAFNSFDNSKNLKE